MRRLLAALLLLLPSLASAGLQVTSSDTDFAVTFATPIRAAFDTNGTAGFTVEWAWRHDTDPGANRTQYVWRATTGIAGAGGQGPLAGVGYNAATDQHTVLCRGRSSLRTFTITTPETATQTHMYACRYCGSSTTDGCVAGDICAYRDGVLVSACLQDDGFSSTPIAEGSYIVKDVGFSSTSGVGGTVEEIRQWSTIRTTTELAEFANCSLASNADLTHHWTLADAISGDCTAGTTIADSLGTANGTCAGTNAANFTGSILTGACGVAATPTPTVTATPTVTPTAATPVPTLTATPTVTPTAATPVPTPTTGVFFLDDLSSDCTPSSRGTGTFADPFVNIFDATRQLACGSTLYLRAGTYRVNTSGFGSSHPTWADNCNYSNQDTAVMYFTQACPANNPITIEPYYHPTNGYETVIIDGTPTEIDDASPASHWTQCESATQCGTLTSGFTLPDYTRTYYSESWNYGSGGFQQLWLDPPAACQDADDPVCTVAAAKNPGRRLKHVAADNNASTAADMSNLTGGCTTTWGIDESCGTYVSFGTGARFVVRLPDTSSSFDPDNHVIKVGSDSGAVRRLVVANGASNIRINGRGTMVWKYSGYQWLGTGGANNNRVENVTLVAAGGWSYGQAIRTSNESNSTFTGLDISNVAAECVGFYGGGHGSCVQITNNTLENSTVSNCGYGEGSNMTASGSALSDGVIIKSCNGCVVRNSRVDWTGRSGVEVTSNWNGAATCDANSVIVDRNEISRWGRGQNAGTIGGIWPVTPGTQAGNIFGLVLTNNMIHTGDVCTVKVANPGIHMNARTRGTIANNYIYNTCRACITTEEQSDNVANSVIVRNNVFHDCNTSASGAEGYVTINNATDWAHSNNAFYATSGTPVLVRIKGTGATTYTSASLANWEATGATAYPNPLSTVSGAINLRLRPAPAATPMVNAGTNVNCPNTDKDGATRPGNGTCDIGAHELDAAVAVATPTATVTPTPTVTATTVATPTAPDPTVTATPSVTPTATVTATLTAVVTVTPTPTATPTVTATPTLTALPTATPTVTPTPAVPTSTPSPSPTATATSTAATPTATATLSPTPTATPTPDGRTCLMANKALRQKIIDTMPMLSKELCP